MPEILPDNLYKIMKAGEKSTVELKQLKTLYLVLYLNLYVEC